MDAHTYKRLLFGGAAIAGAAAVATIWPVGAVAAVAAGVAGGVGGNFLHQCSDDLAAALAKSPAYATDYLHNQDLRRLVGETVAARLKVLADDDTLPEQTRRRLPVLAIKAEEGWLTLADHELLQGLNEVVVTGLFAMSAASFAKATALDASTWASFLTYLESKVADESTFETLRRTYTQDMKALRSKPLDSAAYSTLGEILQRTIPHDLSIAAKQAFAQNKPAYAALQLRLMRDLMTDVRDVLATVSRMADRVDQLFVGQTEILKKLTELTDSIKGKAPAVGAVVPAVNAHDVRDILDEVEAFHRDVSTLLARIEAHTALLPGMQATQVIHGKTLARIEQAVAGGGSHRSTDNLSTAGAQANPNFIGRTAQLADLASFIDDPKGPPAVVIVAGAGFGKTELAKEFMNHYAHPTPARTSAAGTDPNLKGGGADQWTARWWINGSKGGEAKSLKDHYEIITGEPLPEEPRPAPGQDAATAAAEFRTSLRRDIAAACSTERQLIVIDNAETTEQIREYRPSNRGRLIATTRRQPIPKAVGREFVLDVMTPGDSLEVLVSARPDLLRTLSDARAKGRPDPDGAGALRAFHAGKALAGPIESVAAMAEHLGHHALALAYAAAALARPPFQTPEAVLSRMVRADVGDEGELLAEFGKDDLGTEYKLGLAQSLGLLLDELADTTSPSRDALALDLATLAAYCNPSAIPVSLLVAASEEHEDAVAASLRALHERSIVTVTETVSLHRLTQSLLRGRAKRTMESAESSGGTGVPQVLGRLLDALIELFRWPADWEEQRLDHTKTPARLAALAHAEAVIAHAEPAARGAGDGGKAPLPRTATLPLSTMARELAGKAPRLRGEMAKWFPDVGMHADAERHFDAAITWEEAQTPRDERRLAVLYASRARNRQDRGDLEGAEKDIARSIDWEEAQTPRDERGLAVLYGTRASIRQLRGDLEGAEKDIARSIDWGETQTPRDEWSLAIDYSSRASIRRTRGDLAGAEQDIERAITWGEAQTPRDERSLAIWYASRASIRQVRRDLEGAEKDIAGSIAWGEAQTPRDERSLAIRYASRASIRQDRGDLAGAEDDIAKSINWGESQTPRDERSLAIWHATRASIRQSRDDLAGAEDDIAKNITWGESQNPRDEEDLAFRHEDKAVILAKAGKFPQARAAIDESVRLHTAVFGADHEWTKGAIRYQQAIHAGEVPG